MTSIRPAFLVFLLFIASQLLQAEVNEYYIEIPLQRPEQIRTITSLVSIHKVEENRVFAFATDRHLNQLALKGIFLGAAGSSEFGFIPADG